MGLYNSFGVSRFSFMQSWLTQASRLANCIVKGVKHCTVIPIKDQKAMCVGGVESGVCGFYTTLHTEYCYSCQRCQRLLYLLPLPGGKAIYLFEPSILEV